MTMRGKEPENRKHQVFISYSNEKSDSTKSDRQVVDMICSALESKGIRCWIAHRDILPGEGWLNALIDAVIQSKVMILVFSSNSDKSPWVEREVTRALRENVKIIPFRIQNVSPRGPLRVLEDSCQWMDAYTPPLDKHVGRLVEVVRNHLKKESEKPFQSVEEQPEIVKVDASKDEKKRKKLLKQKWILFAASIIVLLAIAVLLKDQPMKINKMPVINKKEKIKKSDEMPEDVKTVVSKGIKVEKKNDLWEAYYRDGIVMVYIPSGRFTMGQTEEEKKWLIEKVGKDDYNYYYTDERPPHIVYLDGYWMGKTEVTVRQYIQFVNETESHYPEWLERGNKYNIDTGNDDLYKKLGSALRGDNYPIVGISWHDAVACCVWLSNKTGVNFKLPTEAQWEKAARGTSGLKYPWGNHDPYYKGKWYANYAAHDSWNKKGEDGFQYTARVDSYPQGASPYSLLNMAGNVWEWCKDWYGSKYYQDSPPENPKGLESGSVLVLRGGSWNDFAWAFRCANRSNNGPSYRYSIVGFRLCMENE